MITDTQMEKMKRREIILFKWRIIHYIRRKETEFINMLHRFHMENQTEYVFEKDMRK
jgi:hypothetical protein